jgi:phenylalanyl-tRNA synthetase beta chain
MHAFDLGKLSGGINVRLAEQGEAITLLDGQEIKLNADTMVIADNTGVLAIAGVMGGKASAVSETTRDIFLESAFFNPLAIAGRARSYGCKLMPLSVLLHCYWTLLAVKLAHWCMSPTIICRESAT